MFYFVREFIINNDTLKLKEVAELYYLSGFIVISVVLLSFHCYFKMSTSPTPEAAEKGKGPVEQLSENVAELYLESFSFTTAAAIIGYVDSKFHGCFFFSLFFLIILSKILISNFIIIGKVCVTMTDGRQLFGVLRTFDQYGE